MEKRQVKKLFTTLNANRMKVLQLEEDILYLETVAEKITTSYSEDKGGGSFDTTSKIEKNCVKIADLQTKIDFLRAKITHTEDLMLKLKPYQRYIVSNCIVHHIPYSVMAEQEDTTANNIQKIIDNAINWLL